MLTARTVVTALAVAAAVVLPATGAVAAPSGSQPPSRSREVAPPAASPVAEHDALATTPTTAQGRVWLMDLINSFLFCDDAGYDTMFPPDAYFVTDCMRGAPASNG